MLTAATLALTKADVKDLISDYAIWIWFAIVFIAWSK